MMAGLLLAFVGQTALVYTDDTADAFGELSALELEGRAIWHRNNCQTCHQIYGFGGFLGPDLTNAAARINRHRLDTILTEGAGQMPPFHMAKEEIDAIEAFLGYLNKTGVGQARVYQEIEPADVYSMIEEHCGENPMPPAALRGYDRFKLQCSACHTPFRATTLGPFLAADLSTVAARLSPAELEKTLVEGRIDRGMPPTGCDDETREDLKSFFTWLAAEEPALRPRCDAAKKYLGLPWFEYR